VPGSNGEHHLQERYGTAARARAFYDHQVLEHLSERMRTFVEGMDMVFIATADAAGNADCSLRAGPPGFVGVLDERTLVYPEYRGNGVMSSLGNLAENAGIGMLFVDFCGDAIGLHVNGRAALLESEQVVSAGPLPEHVVDGLLQRSGRRPDHWVRVDVVEAYIHCSKHITRMARRPDSSQAWATDDQGRKAARRRRRGLHPLLQAHPADGAAAGLLPGLGNRRPEAQGRRLLRGQVPAATVGGRCPRPPPC
jgi:predicted pyridoxine 5'-phosphate oxidase superfamily flavin-nucleotide-binding protein